MEDVSNAVEPVQVFIRIRPENLDSDGHRLAGSRSVSPRSSSVTSLTSGPPDSPSDLKCVVQIDERTVRVIPPDGALGGRRKSVSAVDEKLFTFDNVFGESSSQEELYQCVSAHIKATVRGYNTTIFAYGSTGSGKSHTMTGNSSAPGIIPRAISEVFSIIETTAAQESDVFFYVRISYVELYNNNFRNLLEFASKELAAKEKLSEKEKEDQYDNSDSRSTSSPRGGRGRSTSPTQIHPGLSQRHDKIEVRESQSAGVFLAGPNLRIPVTTAQEAFQLIAKGNKSRAVGSTQCNDQSSRSHAILTLHVESRVPSVASLSASTGDLSMTSASASGDLRLGKMHLVDLAGSERIAMSGAEGDTLVETQNINLSLTALGDVLSALSKNATVLAQQLQQMSRPPGAPGTPNRAPQALVPVPYRNSKLTHLLKDSLGGNSKTIMIANVRTLSDYYQQSAVTLMYASRAKKIRNRSLINQNVIGDTGIHAVTIEIERLRTRLDDRSKEFERLCHVQMKDAKENMALKMRLQELTNANESEKKQLEKQMSHIIHSQAGQLVVQKERFSQLQTSLQEELLISQERIAEQEREIKFLKKALDETTEAQKQPVEQLERMKKVVEAWQSQAQSTQQELASVVQQSEILRAHSAALQKDLDTARVSTAQLMGELTLRTNEAAQKGAVLTKSENEREELFRKLEVFANDNRDLKDKLKSAIAVAMEKDAMNKELHNREGHLEKDMKKWEIRSNEAAARISELEGEKVAMHKRLKDTISELEQRTSQTFENANLKLKEHEEKRRIAEQHARQLESDLSAVESQLDVIRSDALRSSKEHEEALQLARDELVREKETSQKLVDRAGKLEQSLRELEGRSETELQEEREVFLKQRDELLAAQDQEKSALQRQLVELEAKLRSEFQKEFTMKEQSLLKKFSASENETKRSSEEKMQSTLANTIAKHDEIVEKIRNENSAALQRLQEELQRSRDDHESDLHNLEESHASLLQQRHEQLLEEKNREIETLAAEHRQLTLELEKKKDVEAENLLNEQKDQLARMHSEEIEVLVSAHGASQERIAAVMADMKEKHKEQLKASLAAQKEKLETYYEEKLAAAAEAASAASAAFSDQKRLLENQSKESAKEIEARLRAQHVDELASLKAELLREQEQSISEAKAEERESVLNSEKTRRKEMVRDFEAHHKKQMDVVRAEADEVSRRLEEMHADRLQDLDFQTRSTLDNAIATERAAAEKRLTEKVSVLEKMLQEEKERELQELRLGFERELQEAVASGKKALKDGMFALDAKKDKEAAEKLAAELANRSEELQSSLAALRSSLAEQHKRELADTVSDLKNRHVIEMQAALSETQTEAGERFSHSMNELIERIGRENREALATQKSRLEDDRRVEADRLQERLNRALEAHREEIDGLNQQHSSALTALRESLTSDKTDTVKAIEAEKARSLDSIRSEMQQSLRLAKEESQQAQQSLRGQMEVLRDRSRDELNALRADKLDSEVKHQRELSDTLEKHMAELSSQRQQIESSHEKALADMREELSRTREHYEELFASVSARQDLEVKAIRDQRQEFDQLLRNALLEKEEHHKQVVGRLTDAHAAELSRIVEESDREKTRLDTEISRLKKNHEMELQKTEAALRDKLVKELAAAEDAHHQELTVQVADLSSTHRDEIKSMRAEFVAAEERAQRAILGTAEQQQELTLSMARMRTQFEREKAELSEASRSELLAVEDRHRSAIAAAEARNREKIDALEASHQQRISSREEELVQAHAVEQSELKKVHKQRLKDVEDLHRKSVEAAEQSFREETDRLNDLTRGLRASMESQQQDIIRQRDELVSQLQGDSQAALEALRRQLQTENVALKKCHADNVTEIVSAHEEQVNALRRELDSLRTASENKRREMESDFNLQLARASEQSDLSRERLTADFETQLALLREGQCSEINTLKETHSQELYRSQQIAEEMKATHETALSDLRNAMALETEATQSKHEAALSELRNAMALETEATQSKHEAALSELRNAMVLEAEAKRNQHDTALSELRDAMALEAEATKSQHEAALSELRDAMALEAEATQSKHETALSELRNAMALEAEAKQSQHEAALSELRNAMVLEAEATQSQYEAALSELRVAMALEAEAKRNQHEAALSELNAMVLEAEAKRNQHEAALSELREAMVVDAENIRSEQLSALARLQQRHSEELAAQSEQAVSTQQEVLHRALTALRDELERQREEDLTTLSIEAVSVSNKLKAKLVDVEQKYSDLEHAHNQTIEDRAAAERELALTRGILDRTKEEYEQQLVDERKMHDQELEVLHMELTEDFNQKFTSFQVQLQDLDGFKESVAAAEQRCTSLQEIVRGMKQSLSAASVREADLQVRLESQRAVNKELEEAKQHRDNEIAILKANNTILSTHYEEARGTLSDVTNKIETVVEDKTRLQYLVSELEDSRRQHDESQHAAELKISGLENLLRAAEQRVIDLDDAHHQDVQDHESSLQRISKLEAQLSEEAEVREQLEASLAKLRQDKEGKVWSSAQAEISRLRSEVATASATAQEALAARAKDGERIQQEYLLLLQQRIDAAMNFFRQQRSSHSNSNNAQPPRIEAVHDQFLAILSDLSDMWRAQGEPAAAAAGTNPAAAAAGGGGFPPAPYAAAPLGAFPVHEYSESPFHVLKTFPVAAELAAYSSTPPPAPPAPPPAPPAAAPTAIPLQSANGNASTIPSGLTRVFVGVATVGIDAPSTGAAPNNGESSIHPSYDHAVANPVRRPSITSYSDVSDLENDHDDWPEVDNESSIGNESQYSKDANSKNRGRTISHMRRTGSSPSGFLFSESESQKIRAAQFSHRPQLPWTSSSSQSSPTDQLVAAIMDGDVQGVRTVVRSKGEDFKSDYWRDLTRSILPLHRAISGLHFHGSEKLLVATLETLMHLGANPNEQDRAGNTALHKAIQVCTSKSVTSVVNALIARGASPSIRNREGDSPMHSECKRVRTASNQVLALLLRAGADPDSASAPSSSSGSRINSNDSSAGVVNVGGRSVSADLPPRSGSSTLKKDQKSVGATPLTLILLRGAAAAAVAFGDVSVGYYPIDGLGFQPIDTGSEDELAKTGAGSIESISLSDDEIEDHSHTHPHPHSHHDSVNGLADSGSVRSKATNNIGKSRSKGSGNGNGNGNGDNRLSGRGVWVRTAEQLVKSGSRWDASWRSSRGASQLHLLLSGFPPSKEDMAAYKFLLTSALTGGLAPSIEDNIGRNCLFALCERLSTITVDACPDYTHVLRMLLDYGNQGSTSRSPGTAGSVSSSNLGGSDRTGKTIFDIEEKVTNSCLSAVKPLLIEAIVQSSPYKENQQLWAEIEKGGKEREKVGNRRSVTATAAASSSNSIVPGKSKASTLVGIGAGQSRSNHRYASSPKQSDSLATQASGNNRSTLQAPLQASNRGAQSSRSSYFSSPSASFSSAPGSPMELEISPSPSAADNGNSSRSRWNSNNSKASLLSPSSFSLSADHRPASSYANDNGSHKNYHNHNEISAIHIQDQDPGNTTSYSRRASASDGSGGAGRLGGGTGQGGDRNKSTIARSYSGSSATNINAGSNNRVSSSAAVSAARR